MTKKKVTIGTDTALGRPRKGRTGSVLRRGAAHYTYGAADPAGLVGAIPGTLADRRSPLGELNWVLTAVADSIAWQLLPQPLFRRLFRQVRLYLLPGPYCPALTSRPR